MRMLLPPQAQAADRGPVRQYQASPSGPFSKLRSPFMRIILTLRDQPRPEPAATARQAPWGSEFLCTGKRQVKDHFHCRFDTAPCKVRGPVTPEKKQDHEHAHHRGLDAQNTSCAGKAQAARGTPPMPLSLQSELMQSAHRSRGSGTCCWNAEERAQIIPKLTLSEIQSLIFGYLKLLRPTI